MNLAPQAIAALERAAVRSGDLRPLMTRTQRRAHSKRMAKRHPVFFLDCSRRWGKTIYLVMSMFMQAFAKPGSIIRYCAPTKLHGRAIVIPAVEWLSAKVPQAMRPTFNRQDNIWVWENGSRCYLGSAETIADCDAQVGTECDLAILDEGAKIRSDVLKHWHKTVIVHQFLTTRGTLLIGSTPALTPAHYLTKELRARAMDAGACVKYTIDDCDHVTLEAKQEAIDECGGAHTPEAKRELYCDNAPDPTWLVIPEWLGVENECIAEVPIPEFVDWYAAADFGFEDLSVVLYAWFDFESQRIIVEHEIAMHRVGSVEVGNACKTLESMLGIRPLSRVADAPLQQLADIAHPTLGAGIGFGPASKIDAAAALAHVRAEVGRKRIIVHPRCETLIAHLGNATWNTARTTFDRVEGFGHWDAIDALKYLCRAVNRRKNPEPVIPVGVRASTHFIHPELARQAQRNQRVPLGRGGRS